MRYLSLLADDPDVPSPEPGSPEFLDVMAGYRTATAPMAESGVLVDTAPLQPPSSARSVRLRAVGAAERVGLAAIPAGSLPMSSA